MYNKKGQVYILVAIVLCVALFGIVSVVNRFEQDPMVDDFEEISENYKVESQRFINSVLNKGNTDIQDAFPVFTYAFTSYSKSKTPGYGLIYALSFEDEEGKQILIGNFLSETIEVASVSGGGYVFDGGEGGERIIPGCYNNVKASVAFGGLSFDVGADVAQLGLDECTRILSFNNPTQYIMIDGVVYPFEISDDVSELMIVGRLDKEEQRKVYVGDKYVRPQ